MHKQEVREGHFCDIAMQILVLQEFLDAFWTVIGQRKVKFRKELFAFPIYSFISANCCSAFFDFVLRRKKWFMPCLKSSDGAGKVRATLNNTVKKGKKLK